MLFVDAAVALLCSMVAIDVDVVDAAVALLCSIAIDVDCWVDGAMLGIATLGSQQVVSGSWGHVPRRERGMGYWNTIVVAMVEW